MCFVSKYFTSNTWRVSGEEAAYPFPSTAFYLFLSYSAYQSIKLPRHSQGRTFARRIILSDHIHITHILAVRHRLFLKPLILYTPLT